ncbi:hypothetical protein [Chitinimonas naiadis]
MVILAAPVFALVLSLFGYGVVHDRHAVDDKPQHDVPLARAGGELPPPVASLRTGVEPKNIGPQLPARSDGEALVAAARPVNGERKADAQ